MLIVRLAVAIYTEPRGDMMCMYQGQQGGVTHIRFSPDGNLLFTGGRKVSCTHHDRNHDIKVCKMGSGFDNKNFTGLKLKNNV